MQKKISFGGGGSFFHHVMCVRTSQKVISEWRFSRTQRDSRESNKLYRPAGTNWDDILSKYPGHQIADVNLGGAAHTHLVIRRSISPSNEARKGSGFLFHSRNPVVHKKVLASGPLHNACD